MEKNQLLRSLFPVSFTVDISRGRVLTKEVNRFLFLNPCESNECNVLEIKKETDFATRLIMGGRPVSNRRPPEPQSGALIPKGTKSMILLSFEDPRILLQIKELVKFGAN